MLDRLKPVISKLDITEYYTSKLGTLSTTPGGWRVVCPFHTEPGAATIKRLYISHDGSYSCSRTSCPQHEGGTILQFEAAHGEHPNEDAALQVLAELANISAKQVKLINPKHVDSFHAELISNADAMSDAKSLGLSAEVVATEKLGWHEGRIVVPLVDKDGAHDLRAISPHRPTVASETLTTGGPPSLRRFRAEKNLGSTVCLFSSELEVIVAERLGVEDADCLVGDLSDAPRIKALLGDRRVYDCSGRSSILYQAGCSVSACKLDDGCSVFNWEREQGRDLRNAIVHSANPLDAVYHSERLSFSDAYNAEYTDRPVRTTARLIGRSNTDYRVPKLLTLECHNNMDKVCRACPLNNIRRAEFPVDLDSDILLRLLDKTEDHMLRTARRSVGVPQKCQRNWLVPAKEYHNIYEVELAANSSNDLAADRARRTCYLIGSRGEANRIYEFGGRVMIHPYTQRIVGVWDSAVPQREGFDAFQVSPTVIESLQIFQPAEGQTPSDKLAEIAEDLEQHVHGVGGRNDMNLAVDLIMHSILNFSFRGEPLDRGWLQGFIIGDTAQAKTQMAERLMEHYGVGEKVSGDLATVAGLLGGVDVSGKAHTLIWGTLPMNDRGFVLIDEMHKMDDRAFSQLSETRSSGKVKITKIISDEADARVRLLIISNPKMREGFAGKRNVLSHYEFGVNAVEGVMGANENIRRLDFAMAVGFGEVSGEEANQYRPVGLPGTYTSELCHTLLMWCWSRKPENVHFTPDAEEYLIECAEQLSTMYSDSIPLVVSVVQKSKLARLAAACAARLFSTDDTGEKVIVTRPHVVTVANFLDSVYDNPIMGYGEYSEYARREADIGAEEIARLLAEFVKFENAAELCRLLLRTTAAIDNTRLRDVLGYNRKQAEAVLHFMAHNSLGKRVNDKLHRNERQVKLLRVVSQKFYSEKKVRF